MPIYEYKCTSCGRIESILVQGYKSPDGMKCSACGSAELKRIISKVNYHLSGSDRLDSYDPNARQSESFLKDTRNIGLHAEHMLKKSGVKPTEEFKTRLEKLRTDPASVIKNSGDE
ncbi:MAG TPA: hypothetical protein ENN05_06335 [Deltaproteobacteria bacterium]|nr:hypothetical protein [Deltaproteobacteria bacterium]